MPRDIRLSKFRQSLEETGAGDAYEIVPFAGDVTPILVRQDNTYRLLTQSGEAVAWGAYLKPPAPLFPSALLDRPKVHRSRVGPSEFKTTWSYTMALAPGDTYNVFTHTRWPIDPAVTPGFDNPT